MSRKYKFHNPSAAYFVTFATVRWVDVFTRHIYFSILAESLEYCRHHKGMELFAYVFMPNHVHMVIRSTKEDPSGLLRDFKGFTSRKLIKTIKENPGESRKEWMLKIFEKAGNARSNVSEMQFWQQHNHPMELWNDAIVKQKVDYIHYNPVKAGLVTNPEDWKYSSARNYAGDQTVLEIDRNLISK